MKNIAKAYREKSLRTVARVHRNTVQKPLSNQSDSGNTVTINESLYKAIIKADKALNFINDAIMITDVVGNIEYLNLAAEFLSGWKGKEAYSLNVNQVFKILDINTRQVITNINDLLRPSNKAHTATRACILVKQDGSEVSIENSIKPIFNGDGEFDGLIIVFYEESKAKEINLKMAHLAQHDFLTNLPNRLLLHDRIGQAIASANRLGTQVALLFLDLDGFKNINDSYGHATGDIVLQSVANCLSDCVRHTDTVSRQGGDEFIVLLAENKASEDVVLTAEKILKQISLPRLINQAEHSITTSIGISIYPNDGKDADSLIENADTAMYYAKKRGRNNYQFFASNMKTNRNFQ